MKTNKRKIRNYFINSQIQMKMAFNNMIYMSIIIIVIVLSILSPLHNDIFDSNNLCMQYITAQFLVILIGRLAVAISILFVAAFIHQIVITHQFCGPLVNFNKTFKKMSNGDFTRKVFLRKKDMLKEEEARVNEIIDNLSEIIGNIKTNNQLLQSALEEADKNADERMKNHEIFKKIKKQADLCTTHLSKFEIINEET